MRTRTVLVVVAMAVIGLVLQSCSRTAVRYRGRYRHVVVVQGPPPYAPTHGYRHKHSGVVLVYQSNLGAYAVERRAGYYFYNGNFYRSSGGTWQMGASVAGPWRVVKKSKVPHGLRRELHAKKKKRKHHH